MDNHGPVESLENKSAWEGSEHHLKLAPLDMNALNASN